MNLSTNRFLPGLAAISAVFALPARAETRLPVISRMQVLYSAVSHYMNLQDRINYYNTFGNPQGSNNYAVAYLVFEPIVTLYNPYNTPLVLPQSRVRISNPPVGFKLRKNSDYLRSEWTATSGPYLGLGRFQISGESSANVQKHITLSLGGGDTTAYAGPITLAPGESRQFSVRVEQNWTWSMETVGTFNSRSFFDWNAPSNFTNKDGRTGNLFGAEAIQGIDFRAGFQTDHLALSNARPVATCYPWESNTNRSWIAIKLTDSFGIDAKGVDTVANPDLPDFQLSLLGGAVTDVTADTLRSYSFSIGDLMQPETANADAPVVTRSWKVSDILQTAADPTPGGKTPFASFVLAAKSSALQQRKFQAETLPPANELYEARLDRVISGFTDPVIHEGPTEHPESGVIVTGSERVGDLLMLDVAAPPLLAYASWKIKGTTDLAAGFPDDLTATTVFREGPVDTGVYKLSVPVPPGGERYFVRIEY